MKPLKFGFGFLFLLLAATAFIVFLSRRERSRNEVVDQKLLIGLAGSAQGRELKIAQQRIITMGTNALPSLLRALQTDYSPSHQWLSTWAMKKGWLIPLRRHYFGFERPDDFRRGACEAFRVLGPLAKPAIPALEEALSNPVSALQAMGILARPTDNGDLIFGPEVYTSLLKGLTNNNPAVRERAVIGLGAAQTNADLVVPALLLCLRDSTPEVRGMTAFELGGRAYGVKSADIIPALIPLLSDSDSRVKRSASFRLKMFGLAATNALSALVRVSKEDRNSSVRKAAADAIEQIQSTGQ